MMGKVFHWATIFVFIFLNGCNINKEKEKTETTNQEPKDTDTQQETKVKQTSSEASREATRRNEMEEEVAALWRMYLSDHDTPSRDKRWAVIDDYAESLVKYVRYYQENGVENNKDIVYLPEHKNAHLLIATMVTFETALWHEVVGSRGEVGLLQVHGVALNGFDKKDVINNPDLGLRLGIRWLTKQIPYCNVPSSREWTDNDWLGPLSIYGGGINRAKKNGKCLKFRISKRRVEYTKYYRDRIDDILSV